MDDKAILGRFLRDISGTCRVCGCHGDSCRISSDENCAWLDEMKTLCSNPKCAAQAIGQQKKYKYSLRRRGYKGKRRAA
jgi:hypothetical protein